MKNNEPPTHGIVHTGFRGIQAFVTRKKSGCNLIVNRFVIPHDTIPSNVTCKLKKKPAAQIAHLVFADTQAKT